MIIFLYGRDSFRSYQKLKEIVKKYREKNPDSLSLHKIDVSSTDLKEIKLVLSSSPLFEEKKLVILKRAFSLDAEKQKKFTALLKEKGIAQDKGNILVFITEGEPDKRTVLFKYLNKYSRSQKFDLLNKPHLRVWVKKIIDDQFPELEISNYLIEFLITNLGPDLWRIYQELQKMDAYQKSNHKKITKEDIEKLVVFSEDSDIFKTIDALASKKKKEALRLLQVHFKNLEPELKILAMFEFQFRTLIKIKALIDKRLDYYSIQRQTKLHPFVFRKAFQLSKLFSMEELKNIYEKLFKLDLGFKTGAIQDKQIALEMFVVKLCQH